MVLNRNGSDTTEQVRDLFIDKTKRGILMMLKWFRWEIPISQEVFKEEERLLWCKNWNFMTCASNCDKHKPVVCNCPPANLGIHYVETECQSNMLIRG